MNTRVNARLQGGSNNPLVNEVYKEIIVNLLVNTLVWVLLCVAGCSQLVLDAPGCS